MSTSRIEQKKTNNYLSQFAKMLRGDIGNVADFIAPPFKVKHTSDKYLSWGKHNFRIYDNKVGRREKPKEVELYATDETYTCEKYELAGFVAEDDLDNIDAPIRLKEDKVKNVQAAQMRSHEYRVLSIATNTGIVTNYSSDAKAWDTSSGTPVSDLIDALISIDDQTNLDGNACVMGKKVALNMIKTDEWKDYFKYTWGLKPSGNGLFDAVQGLRMLGLDVRLSRMRGLSTYQGTASDPTWETMIGENVLVFHREAAPTTQTDCFMFSPYVYLDRVRQFWDDKDEGWEYRVAEKIDELVVDAGAAYLFTNVLS